MSSIFSVIDHPQPEVFSSKDYTWSLGSRDNIKFWKDLWTCNQPLMTIYPRLYDLNLFKDCKLSHAKKIFKNDSSLLWKRPFKAWEQDDIVKLLNSLSSFVPKDEIDKIIQKMRLIRLPEMLTKIVTVLV